MTFCICCELGFCEEPMLSIVAVLVEAVIIEFCFLVYLLLRLKGEKQ